MLQLNISQAVIDRLPSPRGVALALTDACRKETVHLEEIAALVRTDPALSGRLLAMANAAASGSRSVASADEAVARLGVTSVCQISLAFSLIDQHSAGYCSNFDYAGFWSHSVLMASASRELGTVQRLGTPGNLFTVGLLSQIGRLALATAFPKEYSELVVSATDLCGLLQAEQALSRTDQLHLSVALMEHWGVPADLARPFGYREIAGLPDDLPSAARMQLRRLAQGSWEIATILRGEGADALLQEDRCQHYLDWLQIDRAAFVARVESIESVCSLWLGMMAKSR